jgi:hypothetical protein
MEDGQAVVEDRWLGYKEGEKIFRVLLRVFLIPPVLQVVVDCCYDSDRDSEEGGGEVNAWINT